MDSWRALAGLGLASVGLGVTLVVAGAPSAPEPAGSRPVTAPADPLATLHRWDAARARAWAEGDTSSLRRLYVTGSAAGRADVRLLSAYRTRGLVVRDLRMQVLAARVVHSDARRLRVVVTDRLAGGLAVSATGTARLPSTRASTRTLVLRREAGRWRMVSVRPATDRRRSPPPRSR